LLNLFPTETSPQMTLTRNTIWRRTHTHKSTPAVHKNSAHQNLLHYCELEYLNKETATNLTRQQSTLNWKHYGSSRELPASKVLWSDWILRNPRRAGLRLYTNLGWVARVAVGRGNQSGESHEDSRPWPYSFHTVSMVMADKEDSRHTISLLYTYIHIRKNAARLQRLLPYCSLTAFRAPICLGLLEGLGKSAIDTNVEKTGP